MPGFAQHRIVDNIRPQRMTSVAAGVDYDVVGTDQHITVTGPTTGTSAHQDVNFPAPSDMPGRTVVVDVPVKAGADDVIVKFKDTEPADQTITAAGGYVVAYSDGYRWSIVDSKLS